LKAVGVMKTLWAIGRILSRSAPFTESTNRIFWWHLRGTQRPS
jgi:hypothetical protein